MSSTQQIKVLADYIMADIPGEPSCSEGAGDTAIRLLKRYRYALGLILREPGLPQAKYPLAGVHARQIAHDAISGEDEPWFVRQADETSSTT